jgi:hypothetical protein
MTITISVKIETGDKYNSSTYSEITLDLTDPIEVAIAGNFVTQRIITSLQSGIVDCCEVAV